MSIITWILFMCWISNSCLNKQSKSNTSQLIDSDIEKTVNSLEYDLGHSIDSTKYREFLDYFPKVEAPQTLKKVNKIPVCLAQEVLDISFDTLYDVNAIYSLGYMMNNEKMALFYQIECMAGSLCSRYYVAYIDSINHRLSGIDLIVVTSGTPEEEIDHVLILENSVILKIESNRIKYNEEYEIVLDSCYYSRYRLKM